ncbi:hypothetical protein O181_082051 [Austropuccinia psidii MF-1]|uniref:Tf2-1-like SH3-like domain-containing protein n=1 Tax=Austropuccinia psidii MF-1 TaxID=1389203 RepID=A0A9Q3IGJ5_9BASI|nr:hypothetical protein [Austropuccinia psidii MF-1]
MVWLSSGTSSQPDPQKKLSEGWLGSFPKFTEVGTHSYHLKLPSQWKYVHPVFHIYFLKQVKESFIPNLNQETPPPMIIEEE